jgi:hypothetical protein
MAGAAAAAAAATLRRHPHFVSVLGGQTKKRVLIPAFSRALRDPFPPGRLAGLLGLHGTAARAVDAGRPASCPLGRLVVAMGRATHAATKDMHSPDDVALKVLPAVSAALIDPDRLAGPR